MDGEDPFPHLSPPEAESDCDTSFYRFAVGRCGAASPEPPWRGAWRPASRGRSSLTQHFKLRHRAGRDLALRAIKKILTTETKLKDNSR
ncbi:MAG: hypothetical protein ACLPKB_02795 [Xanthobacteraceae bacterium]